MKKLNLTLQMLNNMEKRIKEGNKKGLRREKLFMYLHIREAVLEMFKFHQKLAQSDDRYATLRKECPKKSKGHVIAENLYQILSENFIITQFDLKVFKTKFFWLINSVMIEDIEKEINSPQIRLKLHLSV